MAPLRQECPVLYPTMEDMMGGFEAYIEKHEKKIAQAGLVKIVPPAGWQARKAGYPDNLDFTINSPIRQHATGRGGIYRMLYVEQKAMSLKDDFRPMALDKENVAPSTSDVFELERKFWKNVTLRPALYGADVPGSLFDEKCKGWNLRRLNTLLSRVLDENGHSLPGVNTPYLYFGMWKSVFAWHTEDMDLYSVNYLHYGAPKSWYCVPPEHRERFEQCLQNMLPDLFRGCPEFLRHKELLISPTLLEQFQVPYVTMTQYPQEFMINYPGAYHAGFNHGYNCAESVNFATKKWIPVGAHAGVCECKRDSVKIDMKLFRDLVPARLLPAHLFEDSSDDDDSDDDEEDSEDEESGSDDDGSERASGSEASSDDDEGPSSRSDDGEEEGRGRKRRRASQPAAAAKSRSGRRRPAAVTGGGRRMMSLSSGRRAGGGSSSAPVTPAASRARTPKRASPPSAARKPPASSTHKKAAAAAPSHHKAAAAGRHGHGHGLCSCCGDSDDDGRPRESVSALHRRLLAEKRQRLEAAAAAGPDALALRAGRVVKRAVQRFPRHINALPAELDG